MKENQLEMAEKEQKWGSELVWPVLKPLRNGPKVKENRLETAKKTKSNAQDLFDQSKTT